MPSTTSSFNSLRFPQDLGTPQVPYYVRFEPQVVQYGGTRGLENGAGNFDLRSAGNKNRNNPSKGPLASGTDFGAGPITFTTDNIPVLGVLDQISTSVNTLFEEITTQVDSFSVNIFDGTGLSARLDLGNLLSSGSKRSSGTKAGGISTDRNTVFSPGSINLYLPEQLAAKSSVDYSAQELGQMGMGAVQQIQKSGIDAFRKDKDGNSMLSGLASLIPGAIQDMAQSDDKLQAAYGIAKGQVTNNFSFQVFQGVGHRSFSYSFKLIARDEDDSTTIKEICDTFVYYMLPSRTSGDFNFYEVPCQWNISYEGPNGKLRYHQQPKPCFLTSVDVTYGGEAGSELYSDGAPMTVELALDFTEIEPLYRGDRFTTEDLSSGST